LGKYLQENLEGAGKNPMIIYKEWDSKILGKRVGEVDIESGNLIEGLQEYDYVTVKIPTYSIDVIRMLEDDGFRVCNTLLTFRRKPAHQIVSPEIVIRLATKNDTKELQEIGRNAFYLDRYHTDPYLTRKEADSIYDSWIENEINGEHGDAVFVATVNNDILGFICCRISGGNGYIDLTATTMKAFLQYKIKHFAGFLLRVATNFFYSRSIYSISTATQSTNIPSINSLLENYFEITESYLILSWRNKK
jgi:hypothetical protein